MDLLELENDEKPGAMVDVRRRRRRWGRGRRELSRAREG